MCRWLPFFARSARFTVFICVFVRCPRAPSIVRKPQHTHLLQDSVYVREVAFLVLPEKQSMLYRLRNLMIATAAEAAGAFLLPLSRIGAGAGCCCSCCPHPNHEGSGHIIPGPSRKTRGNTADQGKTYPEEY